MAKHYKIDDEKKIIYADIMALTEKEEAEIGKFLKYGYVVENKIEPKAKVSRLDDAFILDYLRDDETALKTYAEKKKLPAVDEAGKPKTTIKGKIKRQGFNAGRNWFARNYPLDVSVAVNAIEGAGKTKALTDAFDEYQKKAEKARADGKTVDAMTKDEYTKDFYWKKVFEKK